MSNREYEVEQEAEESAEEQVNHAEVVTEEVEEAVVEVEVVPEPEEKNDSRSRRGRGSSSHSPEATPSRVPAGTFVSLKALVYLGVPRNSASVKAMQTRLVELGYVEAGGEDHGWFGPHTGAALKRFQEERGIAEEGLAGPETIKALFDGVDVEILP